MSRAELDIAICIPVFNDWKSAKELMRQIGSKTLPNCQNLAIVLIDDGSTDSFDSGLVAEAAQSQFDVEIMTLHRNIGHQRAIAIGLAGIAEMGAYDAVVVMDADGEDLPADIAKLIKEMTRSQTMPVVFARRSRRTEGLLFRGGYLAFKLMHWLLTGRNCDVGNFSIIPAKWLKQIVHTPEIWNHYAATVIASKLPISKVDCPRGNRFAGKSHMNTTSLVVHGLRAISVFGETVGVRVCIALGCLILLSVAVIVAIVYVKTVTSLAIPGWATTAAGLTLILLLNLLVLTTPSLLLILGARSGTGYIPARNWRDLVSSWSKYAKEPKNL